MIRFDSRDLIHNTNEAEVSITNRLYVKDDASGQVREAAVLEVWQRRYFDADFGGARSFPAAATCCARASIFRRFRSWPSRRRYSPVAVSFKVNPHWRYALSWRNDYDPLRGRIVNTTTDVSVPDQSEDRRDGGAPRGAGADGALAGEQPVAGDGSLRRLQPPRLGTSP